MATIEADIKRIIVRTVREAGGYARRIEDKYTVGMPDLVIILPDSPVFFIEVKVFSHLSFGPAPRQLVEMDKMNISYAVVALMVGFKGGKYYFCAPKEMISVTDCVFTMNTETFVDTLHRWYNGEVTKIEDSGARWDHFKGPR